MIERHLSFIDQAFNRCCARGLWRASERNMAFARQKARGGVEPNPSCAGQIHLAPSVQIGEVHLSAAWAIERFDIGGELNEIARNKASRKAAMTQQLNQ